VKCIFLWSSECLEWYSAVHFQIPFSWKKHCFCFYIHCGFVGLANDVLILNGIGILKMEIHKDIACYDAQLL